MTLLDGVTRFHQLDKQFGHLLDRLRYIQQQYESQAVPHTTLRLIAQELDSYISLVDQEIQTHQQKADTIKNLDNPSLTAELDLLIQRLTLTRYQLQQYSDYFNNLTIEQPEHFDHHYNSLQEIIDDESLTTKTKELVDLYVTQKQSLPFGLDLDNTVEQEMEASSNSILRHHEYLLSMTNICEKVITQLFQISDLTKAPYNNLTKAYNSPRQSSYIIDSLDITKTSFHKDYHAFLDHTNNIIEDLLHIHKLGDHLQQLTQYPFGSGKTMLSDFLDLCNQSLSFEQIVENIKAYNQKTRIEYLVDLYKICQDLWDAVYQDQHIARELVNTIIASPDEDDRYTIAKHIVQGYQDLSTIQHKNLSMINTGGIQEKTQASYHTLLSTHQTLLSQQQEALIQAIQTHTTYDNNHTSLHKSTQQLQDILAYIQQGQRIIQQAYEVLKTFESVNRDHLYSSIKSTIQQQRIQLTQQLAHQYQQLAQYSIDTQRESNILNTARHYHEQIVKKSQQLSAYGKGILLFQQEVGEIHKQMKSISSYRYTYLDVLAGVKKQYTPTISHQQLQRVIPIIHAHIEKTYNSAYDRYQAAQRASNSSNSSSSSRSSGSSWSSSSSSSSRSSSSSSSSWSGSSGGRSSSGGGSW